MGFWGYEFFQSDRDLDVISDIGGYMKVSEGLYYPENPEAVRQELDSGKLEAAFKHFRDDLLDDGDIVMFEGRELGLVILGAAAMGLGATISDDYRQYLGRVINGNIGLHKPAKDSMKKAVTEYENGKPYDLAGKGLLETMHDRTTPRPQAPGGPGFHLINVPDPRCAPQ